jgi:hypothetical protein
MAAGGFGPYHCLWPNDAPAEYAGITPTPWAMMPMLGFVSYDQGHKLLAPLPNNTFVGFVFCVVVVNGIVILIVINICFFSFNNVDLLHIM